MASRAMDILPTRDGWGLLGIWPLLEIPGLRGPPEVARLFISFHDRKLCISPYLEACRGVNECSEVGRSRFHRPIVYGIDLGPSIFHRPLGQYISTEIGNIRRSNLGIVEGIILNTIRVCSIGYLECGTAVAHPDEALQRPGI
ncbi:hypothetical protein PCH_Pc13g12550 [Penicillium rubens Wisconsin 54-1255]|uniref:Uncharacterized protein n=1 Tax=Penicillium rubens (strain ATCC 28089 / DSM 1075 / NRRL 1951 / Wisconsin 54-1255) TaxID=500485 RepID=B6H346_PENRW|nr:hypothetical protein PCH_Pc13g12550 [Penicillium rubens Wisconsin 54-1255]